MFDAQVDDPDEDSGEGGELFLLRPTPLPLDPREVFLRSTTLPLPLPPPPCTFDLPFPFDDVRRTLRPTSLSSVHVWRALRRISLSSVHVWRTLRRILRSSAHFPSSSLSSSSLSSLSVDVEPPPAAFLLFRSATFWRDSSRILNAFQCKSGNFFKVLKNKAAVVFFRGEAEHMLCQIE